MQVPCAGRLAWGVLEVWGDGRGFSGILVHKGKDGAPGLCSHVVFYAGPRFYKDPAWHRLTTDGTPPFSRQNQKVRS
jgi:hypothetical protein